MNDIHEDDTGPLEGPVGAPSRRSTAQLLIGSPYPKVSRLTPATGRTTSCRIGGGLERFSKVYGYARQRHAVRAASSFWHQGASCIYLFNYDCHRMPKTGSDAYTPDEVQLLRAIH